MAEISPQIPEVGEPTTTEDPKIVNALTTIRDAINGNLDDANIASGADINGNKLLDGTVEGDKLATGAALANLVDLSVPPIKMAFSATNTELGSDAALPGSTSESSALITTGSLAAGVWVLVAALHWEITANQSVVWRLKDGSTALTQATAKAGSSTGGSSFSTTTLIDLYTKAGAGALTITGQGSSAAAGVLREKSSVLAFRLS